MHPKQRRSPEIQATLKELQEAAHDVVEPKQQQMVDEAPPSYEFKDAELRLVMTSRAGKGAHQHLRGVNLEDGKAQVVYVNDQPPRPHTIQMGFSSIELLHKIAEESRPISLGDLTRPHPRALKRVG